MRQQTWASIASAVLVLFGSASVARGERFIDAMIGAALTDNADVTVTSNGNPGSGQQNFDTSFEAGARGGYWFDRVPWLGIGGSVSFFEPDAQLPGLTGFDRADVTVVPITALVMMRALLLQSETFPNGQIQPYLNVGPGAFVTHIHDHDSHFDEAEADVGVDVHAGTYVMITPRLGVFGEYRFTHSDAGVSDEHVRHVGRVDVATTLDTHHVLFGVALRF
jgi:hypothetical protein